MLVSPDDKSCNSLLCNVVYLASVWGGVACDTQLSSVEGVYLIVDTLYREAGVVMYVYLFVDALYREGVEVIT